MRNITLNLDKVINTVKPDDSIRTIQRKLGVSKATVTVEELAYWLHNGASMKAAACNGAKNVDWESQEVFALDFDNGPKEGEKFGIISIDDILERCEKYNLKPAFYYTSFSHQTEKDNFVDKFRIVFISDIKVTDIRVRNVIQIALMNIFPECDKACKDLSRVFYGSKQGVVSLDYDDTINTLDVVQSMVSFIQENNSSSTSAKMVKSYCQTVGLNMINGLPDVKVIDEENRPNTPSSIIYIIEQGANGPKTALNFNIEEGAYKIQVDNTDGKAKGPKVAVDATKIKAIKLIEGFDFDLLANKCQLFREFRDGSRWCYHEEVFGMATNLWRYNKAQTIMIEAIGSNDDYKDKFNKVNTVRNTAKSQYEPMRCANFCPFKSQCENTGLNMLCCMENKRGNIRLVEEIERVELEEGYNKMREFGREGLNNTDANIIYVNKGYTGLGKTTMLREVAAEDPEFFNGTVVAVPNHKLLSEVVDKMKEFLPDLLHVHDIEIADEDVKNKIRALQSLGRYADARKTIEDHIQLLLGSIAEAKSPVTKKKLYDEIANLNSYLELSKEVQSTSRPIFCTHKRLSILANNNVKKIVIDEDIINTLVQHVSIDLDQIEICKNRAFEYKLTKLHTQLELIFNYCRELKEDIVTDYPYTSSIVPTEEIKTLLRYYYPKFNIAELLRIKYAMKNSKGEITACVNNNLPNIPTTILSATANEMVYKALFPLNTVVFEEVTDIYTEGKVILHNTSMSKSRLKDFTAKGESNFDKAVEKIKAEAPGITNIITRKEFASKFKKEGFDVICTYGATTGIDAYGGQDLIVVGTPHANPIAYLFIAHMCGIKEGINMKMDYQSVRRNGFEFSFNTFNNNDLSKVGELMREIQFYLIESELIQAVGRARILRNDCTVHLFSNLPLKHVKLY